MSELQMLAVAYVVFVGLIGVEAGYSLWRGDGRYRLGEAVVNIGHGIVYQVFDSFTKVLIMVPFFAVSALVTWPVLPLDTPWAWVVGVLVYDFCSYWAHRHHHELHFLWAIHGAHHAAEDFNLAAALRQAQFQNVFAWLWKLPLALIMPVEMFVGLIVFDFLYQFLQHTQYVPKLGPIEWVMNTPSHHRVHHGRDEQYLDKNYGGIFIIWDRLFGTFQEEQETPSFGLTRPLHSLNALWGNYAIWFDLARASRRAQGWDRVKVWFAGPAHLDRLAPGGPAPIPSAPIENESIPGPVMAYVMAHFATLPVLLGWMLLVGDPWPVGWRLALGTFIVLGVIHAGALIERRRWVWSAEVGRLVGGALCLAVVTSQ